VAGAVRTERNRNIVTIILDNPAKRNSLDLPLLDGLQKAAGEIAADTSVMAVMLRGGDDKAFCAGADFDAFTQSSAIEQGVAAMEKAITKATDALARLEVPIVAAIRGACFGGGVQLALAADIRIASADSRFGIPAARIGIAYPLQAIAQVVALSGAGHAAQIFLTAEPFDAAAALQRQLIDEVVGIDAFESRIRAVTETIAACPRPALTAYKGMIRKLAFDRDIAAAALLHAELMDSKCYVSRLEEIAQKRK